MLTCIAACFKHISGGGSLCFLDEDDSTVATPTTKQSIKSLTSQIKDMALKPCKPCFGSSNQNLNYADSEDGSVSERFQRFYRRTTGTADSTPRVWGKEMEARLKGLSTGEGTVASVNGQTMSVILWRKMKNPRNTHLG